MTELHLTDEQRALVVANKPLAQRLAMIAWAKSKETQEGGELASVAYVGLCLAAARFDPTRPDIIPGDVENGKAFAGYARQRINGAILDWQRTKDHVPRRTRQIYRELKAQGLDDNLPLKDLAEKVGVSTQTVLRVTHAVDSRPLTIDSEVGDDATSPILAIAPTNVESDAFSASIMEALALGWADLEFEDRSIIANRFFYGQTLGNIAILHNKTTPEIRTRINEVAEHLLGRMRVAAEH